MIIYIIKNKELKEPYNIIKKVLLFEGVQIMYTDKKEQKLLHFDTKDQCQKYINAIAGITSFQHLCIDTKETQDENI